MAIRHYWKNIEGFFFLIIGLAGGRWFRYSYIIHQGFWKLCSYSLISLVTYFYHESISNSMNIIVGLQEAYVLVCFSPLWNHPSIVCLFSSIHYMLLLFGQCRHCASIVNVWKKICCSGSSCHNSSHKIKACLKHSLQSYEIGALSFLPIVKV